MATNKSIQDITFKSRLTIKYRTEISGTPVEAKLPFRVLVLGDLSGKSSHTEGIHGDFAKRQVHSITKGMSPDQLLRMLGFSLKVSEDKLKSHFPGTLRCAAELTKADLKVPNGSDGELSRAHLISEGVKFTSLQAENGVANITKCETYLTATLRFSTQGGDIGNFLGVTLKIRGRVSGEKTDDTSKKVIGTVSGRIHFDTTDEIALAGTSSPWTGTIPGPSGGTVTVEQSPTDANSFTLSVADLKVQAERTIPILNMDAFTPDAVAQSLPELHRLYLIKQLLQELKAEIQSRPDLRKALSDKLKNSPAEISELATRLKGELPKLAI